MASSSTMNTWTEDLARSFLPINASSRSSRRPIDHFTRSIRHHSYARTNQYDVEDRLTGLEEKFQVLNNDELSDGLRDCRTELEDYQLRWLPDVLDLLLRLSDNPVKKTRTTEFETIDNRSTTPPPLKWEEVEGADPINRKDKLWRQPSYSDFSSDDDGVVLSSTATSPASLKHVNKGAARKSDQSLAPQTSAVDVGAAKAFQAPTLSTELEDKTTLTEVQAVREVLLMVQGLPTSLFQLRRGQPRRSHQLKLRHLSDAAFDAVCDAILSICSVRRRLRSWLEQQRGHRMMRLLEEELTAIVYNFDKEVSNTHSQIIRTVRDGGVVNLLGTVDELQSQAKAMMVSERFVNSVKSERPLAYLDEIFNLLSSFNAANDPESFRTLVPPFRVMFGTYAQHLTDWVEHGQLSDEFNDFFVRRVSGETDKARLWHTWYVCDSSGPSQPPQLLASLAKRMLVAGKTRAFVCALAPGSTPVDGSGSISRFMGDIVDVLLGSAKLTLLPFAAAFESALNQYVSQHVSASSQLLQDTLQKQCNFNQTLSTLSHLYLAESGNITDFIESTLYASLDRNLSTWNDRFLVSDLLEEALPFLDHDRIIVQSAPLSSREIRSSRNSVKILETLAIDYILPWPIANILLPDSLASYRRVGLLLSQIRRANYALERHMFPQLRHTSRMVQTTFSTLHAFVGILYSHLTTCVIHPLMTRLQTDLIACSTVDEMIETHQTYVHTLEYACLTAKNLKVLRDTVIALLDICVGFALSNSREAATPEAMTKLRKQFRKHVNLLTAGLRGVARGAGNGEERGRGMSEGMELLADRLDKANLR